MLYIDLETFSSTPITAGVYRYAEDPTFEILMAAYAHDDEPVQLAVGEDAIRAIPGLWDPKVLKVAHNAQFERICLSVLRGRGYVDPVEYHDTMAVAAEKGYPQSLKMLAKALGAEDKDEAGTRLINLFCKPYRGRRRTAEEKPEEWQAFCDYCVQDVATLRDIHKRLGDFPTEMERQVYLADQRINDRGILVDAPMARQAVRAAAENGRTAGSRITELTGVANPNSTQQLMKWLGDAVPNLQAKTIEDALEDESLDPVVREVLELRQVLALTASKKFTAALDAACDDDRVRGSFRFFGAHTGRWAGRGVQLQNLPRAQAENEDKTHLDRGALMVGLGASSQTLKELVRAMFVGPFTVVDYSAIEARVVAWLAGETWALEAFEAGRDIYVETAERMGGMTRSEGKVAVLALGYNGSIGSLRALGYQGSTNRDAELYRIVDAWRQANPHIVQFWGEMDRCFRSGGQVGEFIRIEKRKSTRRVYLPSGRAIRYHGVHWGADNRLSYIDPRGNGRIETYGGRLTENVTQAVARDILAEALVRLENHGLSVVGHVHDEILVEKEYREHNVRMVQSIMNESPDWATGLPIASEGFTCKRYRKG